MNRAELIDSFAATFGAAPEVRAIALDGSMGRGEPDPHSDVDLTVVVADEHARVAPGRLAELIAAACDAVLIKPGPFVTNVVTREWLRVDVVVRPESDVKTVLGTAVHDPHGLLDRREPTGPPPGGDAAGTALGAVEEVLRSLGLLPVAVARDEWIGAMIATGAMLGQLTQLMQIENGTFRIGGALRLSERLTPEQRDTIASFPPLQPTATSVLAVQRALAQDLLPRARRVLHTLGVAYPDALEEALLDHLARNGIDLGVPRDGS
jgi:predicted nucleotidyltransferase